MFRIEIYWANPLSYFGSTKTLLPLYKMLRRCCVAFLQIEYTSNIHEEPIFTISYHAVEKKTRSKFLSLTATLSRGFLEDNICVQWKYKAHFRFKLQSINMKYVRAFFLDKISLFWCKYRTDERKAKENSEDIDWNRNCFLLLHQEMSIRDFPFLIKIIFCLSPKLQM